MATYIPQHYMTVTVDNEKDAASRLDSHYGQGWRVVNMALHADGKKITFLLERTDDQACQQLLPKREVLQEEFFSG